MTVENGASSVKLCSNRVIPLTLAWGWFIGGSMKGILAGAVVGLLISESRWQ